MARNLPLIEHYHSYATTQGNPIEVCVHQMTVINNYAEKTSFDSEQFHTLFAIRCHLDWHWRTMHGYQNFF